MKRCPKCNLEYFDKMIEFCLEDGARLLTVPTAQTQAPTIVQGVPQTDPTDDKTVSFQPSNPPGTVQPFGLQKQAGNETVAAGDFLKENVPNQALKILEIAPVILALAHNWWQWIYMDNQYYPSLAAFLLSANFLMWMLLLTTGAAAGLLAIRFGRNKGYAYICLVILAINLLLFLVPKR